VQHEITQEQPLLKPDGSLTEPGYARSLLLQYDRKQIRAAGYRVIRAVKDLECARDTPESIGVLLECSRGELPGGNGAMWNWSEAKAFAPRPFAIAGGLTPETVVEAATVSGACAVDVSSGVESAPGVKDVKKIRRLLEIADRLPSSGFWREEERV